MIIYCPRPEKGPSSRLHRGFVTGRPSTVGSPDRRHIFVPLESKTRQTRGGRSQIQITVTEHDCAVVCLWPDRATNTDVHAHALPHVPIGGKTSPSEAAACLSVLSSCYEIRGEHKRNLLLGYKTEAAQGKNGNASESSGRGLSGCNHSC